MRRLATGNVTGSAGGRLRVPGPVGPPWAGPLFREAHGASYTVLSSLGKPLLRKYFLTRDEARLAGAPALSARGRSEGKAEGAGLQCQSLFRSRSEWNAFFRSVFPMSCEDLQVSLFVRDIVQSKSKFGDKPPQVFRLGLNVGRTRSHIDDAIN